MNMNIDQTKRKQLLEGTQGLEKYVDDYMVRCILKNQIAYVGGFLEYASSKQMLERIRKKVDLINSNHNRKF